MSEPTTEAGRALLAFKVPAHLQPASEWITVAVIRERLPAIEAEAAAAARAENARLRTALENLLADTEHAEHSCRDADCPVALARAALKGT